MERMYRDNKTKYIAVFWTAMDYNTSAINVVIPLSTTQRDRILKPIIFNTVVEEYSGNFQRVYGLVVEGYKTDIQINSNINDCNFIALATTYTLDKPNVVAYTNLQGRMVAADEIRLGPNVNEIKLRVYELSPGSGYPFGYMSSSIRMWATAIFDLDDDDDLY